jgi:predicted enzyme related to lactoylglutathione lyase
VERASVDWKDQNAAQLELQGRTGTAKIAAAMSESRTNTIDYLEVPSRDVGKSKAFFTALVGWKFTDYGPDYTSFEDGRVNGGFYKSDKVSSVASGAALVVLYSPELEKIRGEAVGLGATIVRDIFSFPGGRRFHFTEPGGSEFSIWSDK